MTWSRNQFKKNHNDVIQYTYENDFACNSWHDSHFFMIFI